MRQELSARSDPSGTALDDLSFDKADLEGDAADHRCVVCGTELWSTYYEINGAPTCEKCRYEVEQQQDAGARFSRFTRALIAGIVAAAGGAGIYYAVVALTGYEIGLIAIVVGFLVGGAVRWGAQYRGGWRYQTLAVALTYVAIVSTYVPFIFQGLDEPVAPAEVTAPLPDAQVAEDADAGEALSAAEESADEDVLVLGAPATGEDTVAIDMAELGLTGWLVAVVLFGGLVLALPFLAGFQNIIGLVIIFFALFQAWKMNKKLVLEIAGPFQVGRRDVESTTPDPAPSSA